MQSYIANIRRNLLISVLFTQEQGNRHRSLNGKDSVLRRRALTLRSHINNPSAARRTTNILAHARETRSIQIARCGNEADHTRTLSTIELALQSTERILKYLPKSPTPEIDVQVLQHILVPTHTRCTEVIQNRGGDIGRAETRLHPATHTLGLILIRRVTNAHLNRHFALHPSCLIRQLRKQTQSITVHRLLLSVGVAQSIRHIEVQTVLGNVSPQLLKGLVQAKLSHGERTGLQLKAVQVLRQTIQRTSARGGSEALRPRHLVHDRQGIGAGTHRRVNHGHTLTRQTVLLAQVGAQSVIHQAYHLVHHLTGGVVATGLLALLGVIDLQEVLVEVQINIRLAPRNVFPGGCTHDTYNHSQSVIQGALLIQVLGQQTQRITQQTVLRTQTTRHGRERLKAQIVTL